MMWWLSVPEAMLHQSEHRRCAHAAEQPANRTRRTRQRRQLLQLIDASAQSGQQLTDNSSTQQNVQQHERWPAGSEVKKQLTPEMRKELQNNIDSSTVPLAEVKNAARGTFSFLIGMTSS